MASYRTFPPVGPITDMSSDAERPQVADAVIEARLHSQHTGRNDGDIIQPGIEDRLRRIRESISVPPVVSVSHHIPL